MKNKLVIVFGTLVLLFGIAISVYFLNNRYQFGLGAKASNMPQNVSIGQITDKTAVISWFTSQPTQTEISYGLSPNSLIFFEKESLPTISHNVKLTNLSPQTQYFFVIKTEEKAFDNNGQPYSFTTTKPLSTPSPTQPPITEQDLLLSIGSNNPLYDLNKDGVINTLDLELFRQKKQ